MRAHDLCAAAFAERHPADAARVLERQAPPDAAVFLERSDAGTRGGLLRHMSPAAAAACLERLGPAAVARALTGLPAEIGASLLRRLAPDPRNAVLAETDPARRAPLERLVRFGDGTAGALADVTAPVFGGDVTAADARRRLRRVVEGAHPYVYVTDEQHRLVGVVHTRDLADARPPAPLGELMRTTVVSLPAAAPLAMVAAHPAWAELDPLPVVDPLGVFIGSLRHQRLRQAATPTTEGALGHAMVRLGELYWLGLAMLMPGFGASSRPAAPRDHAGGADAA